MDKSLEDAPQLVIETPTPPAEPQVFNSIPLWQRGGSRIRHLRGILFEENGIKPKEFEVCCIEAKTYLSLTNNKIVSLFFSCLRFALSILFNTFF